MSIKIYNGYYSEHKSLEEIQNLISDFYFKKEENIINDYYNEIFFEIKSFIDDRRSLETNLYKEFMVKQNEDYLKAKRSSICVDIDFETTICFKYYKNKFYWLLLIPNKKRRDMIVEFFNLKDYEYYDNYDKPNDLTNKEWKERYNTWKNLLNNFGNIKNSGFICHQLIDTIPVGSNRFDLKNFILNKTNIDFETEFQIRKIDWIKSRLFEYITNLTKKYRYTSAISIAIDDYFNKSDSDSKIFPLVEKFCKLVEPIFNKYAPKEINYFSAWITEVMFVEYEKIIKKDFNEQEVLTFFN